MESKQHCQNIFVVQAHIKIFAAYEFIPTYIYGLYMVLWSFKVFPSYKDGPLSAQKEKQNGVIMRVTRYIGHPKRGTQVRGLNLS